MRQQLEAKLEQLQQELLEAQRAYNKDNSYPNLCKRNSVVGDIRGVAGLLALDPSIIIRQVVEASKESN